jgi:hypothetical protein
LLSLLLCTSCAEDPGGLASGANADNVPAIEYERSGGIVGVTQALKVNDSQLTVLDRATGREKSAELTAQERAMLVQMVEEANFFEQNAMQTQPCFDCFEYQLTVSDRAKRHTVVGNDLGIAPSLKPLIQRLSELIERNLP